MRSLYVKTESCVCGYLPLCTECLNFGTSFNHLFSLFCPGDRDGSGEVGGEYRQGKEYVKVEIESVRGLAQHEK